ncbi:MAG: Tetratricopeptide repeat-containing protein [Verrucomicrobiaceae bacterium]|nr:Tetratricopeptide repeat-containing protein [Verrucomicrobiaceae bacterium]MDB6119221.1 Tetratricopeptide repeat-containing protein [Verrucomicrobiaceae bacterium]
MTELDRKILTAQGYMELGLFEDARAELVALPKEAWERTDVLETWVLCQMGEQRWEEALEMSRRLCEMQPKEPSGFIHAAYCLHELGRTEEAMVHLQSGPRSLRTKSVYYYNLGCYCAKLGHVDEAKLLLEKSFEIDSGLRRLAKKDPDLAELRSQLL